MGADDRRNPTVEKMAHGLFFTGRLAMNVDDDGVYGGAESVVPQRLLDGLEGIVQGIHEQPAHGVDDHHLASVFGIENAGADAGGAFGIVHRPEKPGVAVDVIDDLALVPDVVAAGDNVGAGGIERLADLVGDAEAMGRVFTVDDDEIKLQAASKIGQVFVDHPPPRLSHHVAANQYFHVMT